MKIIKKCIYCGGEIKSCDDFYKQDGREKEYAKLKKRFEKKLGTKWKNSENYNCIKCGQMYDEFLKPMEFKRGWLK